MATIPTYTTFVSGTVVTATQLNTQIVNAGQFYLAKPYCFAYTTTGIASVTNNAVTLVPLENEAEDNDGMHSTTTNTSRITFQTPGLFSLRAIAGWATNATGGRGAQLRLNSGGSGTGGSLIASTAPMASPLGGGFLTYIGITYRAVNVGDYTEMFVQQSSGGALALSGGQYATGISALWEIA